MTCVQCGTPTKLGQAYFLPFVTTIRSGIPQQLVACSRACRDEWFKNKAEVEQIQAEMKEYDAFASIGDSTGNGSDGTES